MDDHIAPAAQRSAHQLPRARLTTCQNANDLAREAVSCMGMFGGSSTRACHSNGRHLFSTLDVFSMYRRCNCDCHEIEHTAHERQRSPTTGKYHPPRKC